LVISILRTLWVVFSQRHLTGVAVQVLTVAFQPHVFPCSQGCRSVPRGTSESGAVTGPPTRYGFFGIQRNRDISGLQEAPQRRKEMKKCVLTLALAVATALALSQSAALAKASKGHTAKTTTAKTHHKKHMYKH
jgi:hypothetical protein